MCMQVNVSANTISTVPRQCYPAAITQMMMNSLHCPLSGVMWSERGRRPCLLVIVIIQIIVINTGHLFHASLLCKLSIDIVFLQQTAHAGLCDESLIIDIIATYLAYCS